MSSEGTKKRNYNNNTNISQSSNDLTIANASTDDKPYVPASTHRRIDILRIDYAFSVIIPCLIPIYIYNLNFFSHLDILFGFLMYAITGNTLNDIIDMRDPREIETLERVKGYHWKEIMGISIVTFTFGSMMFVRTISEHPINGLFLFCTVFMVVLYCLKKNIIIFNQLLLGFSHIFFPYLMIKVDAGLPIEFTYSDWMLMWCFLSFAATGQLVHEAIDGDSITRLSLKNQQRIIISGSLLTIVIGIIIGFFSEVPNGIYFLPFIIMPAGTIYTFRKPTNSTQGVKDIGLVSGNIIMFYFIFLIFQQMFG